MHPLSILSASLVLMLALAACGGAATPTQPPGGDPTPAATDGAQPTPAEAPSEAATPQTDLTACELITAEDVAAATGTDVEEGELEENGHSLSPNHTECTYEGDFGRLIVSVNPDSGANEYDAALGSYEEQQQVDVGDGAFYSEPNDRAWLLSGNVSVLLTIFVNDADAVEVSTALFEAAVGRL